jgi:hypothetical protein
MNTKTKKQNPPKPEANSKLLIFNFKLFAFFRFPFGAVAERSGILSLSKGRSVRLPFLLVPFSLFLLTSCPEPTPPDYGLSIEAVDIVCTEATFRAGVRHQEAGDREDLRVGLYRDDSLVVADSLKTVTYLRDEGLMPNTAYSYSLAVINASGERINQESGDSSFVSITTLDTTSHDFTWTVETLGDYGSYLNDVAIVDENNIWVVGYITLGDSIYNAAHWNGNVWEMVNVMFALYYTETPIYLDKAEIKALYYLENSNSLYFTCLGGLTIYENLSEWKYNEMEPMNGVPGNAIWASSPEDVWFVGDKGSIVHYDGSGFQRRESGTETDLTDIKGTPAGYPIYISGRNTHGDNYESPFIQIREDKSLHTLYRSNYPWGNEENWGDIEAIGVSASHVYISPWGRDMVIYNYYFNEFNEYNYRSIPAFYGTRVVDISLVNDNEIYLFDLWGSIIYYNGIKWTLDNSIYHQFGDNNFIVRGSDAIQNYTVVVGKRLSTDQGIVAIGTQY